MKFGKILLINLAGFNTIYIIPIVGFNDPIFSQSCVLAWFENMGSFCVCALILIVEVSFPRG